MRPGEATFGIYHPWALKVTGGGTFNQRLGSGAFRGYGAGVSLIRRFLTSLSALTRELRADNYSGASFMRALITGGAGFIGSHLAEALLDRGHDVMVLDDLSTGRVENIAHLLARRGFSYTIDSVTNEPVVAELMDQCDMTFHLAAAVGVRLVVSAPVHTIETNVHGTETVLRQAAKQRKLVVVASTSEVYGKSTVFPFREDADLVLGPPTKTRWGYAASKLIDEFLALAYWKERQVPVIVVRFFNTVGPRQSDRYGMVIPNFVRQALAGEPLTVHGDGSQTRSFTWVGDVVSALLALVDEPRSVGEVFNIGNGAEVSIRELAAEDQDDDRQRLADPVRALSRGVRTQLRGHVAASAGHQQDPAAGRIQAEGAPRRDSRAGHRLLGRLSRRRPNGGCVFHDNLSRKGTGLSSCLEEKN